MSTEAEVRGASAEFYAALNRMTEGDAGRLADIWSHSATVTTMHPIGSEQVGWSAVRESFEQVAGLASGGHVELDGQVIQVGGEQRVTNVYRREAGQWKIVHHHTDISPAMLGILERLQAA